MTHAIALTRSGSTYAGFDTELEHVSLGVDDSSGGKRPKRFAIAAAAQSSQHGHASLRTLAKAHCGSSWSLTLLLAVTLAASLVVPANCIPGAFWVGPISNVQDASVVANLLV